jgi:hypothetical protein
LSKGKRESAVGVLIVILYVTPIVVGFR